MCQDKYTGLDQDYGNILGCAAFLDHAGNKSDICLACGHDFTFHHREFYRTRRESDDFLSEDSKRIINEKQSKKEKLEEFITQVEKKVNELKGEIKIILNGAATFAAFMKDAIIPYNDAFGEYLDTLIRVE